MSNDNKTLADVRPGRRVRLGDQAERARFEQYRGGDFERDAQGYYTNPRTAQDWAMWQAAISAQPSPGGQGGLNYERMFVDACVALAEVSRELGCDPEQGGAEPILAAIAELRAAQPSPGGQDALETARELLAAEFEKNDVTAAAARRLRNHNQTAVEAAALRVIAARQPATQPDSVALGEATEFCIEKGDRQPVHGSGTLVDSGALQMALNVLRRAGKDEVADALESTAARQPVDENYEIWAQNAENVAAELTDERAIKALRFAARGIRSAARQPVGEPITVEAVATVRRWSNGDRYIDWLTEGGIADLEVGDVLMVSDRAITDEDGSGEVYAAPPEQAVELGDFKALYRAYVRLLESGRDRIRDLGGTCDPVGVMEANDVDLQAARRVIDSQAVGNG